MVLSEDHQHSDMNICKLMRIKPTFYCEKFVKGLTPENTTET